MQKTGRKSAGSAKRSYLLIAHILPAVRGVQPLFNRLADWEQTDKTMCRDDSTHALMNCLVLCVRSSDTWHEGSWPPCWCAQRQGEWRENNFSHSIQNKQSCVCGYEWECAGVAHMHLWGWVMVLAKSVCLISQGLGLGCEWRRECVEDNGPFSTVLWALLAHSWPSN